MTSDGGPIGDLELERDGEFAGVEVKNIESRDGYSFEEHLLVARGLDVALAAIEQFLQTGKSIAIEVSDPAEVLQDDDGKALGKAITDILVDRNGGEGPLRVVERLEAGSPVEELRARLGERYRGSVNPKSVQSKQGNVLVLALPHRSQEQELEDRIRVLASKVVNRQIGKGRRAVICFVYDFASIHPISDKAGLEHWKARLQTMHAGLGMAVLRRSPSVRSTCEVLMGMALVPRTPLVEDLPDVFWVEALLSEKAWDIRADAVGSRETTTILGQERVAEYLLGLWKQTNAQPEASS